MGKILTIAWNDVRIHFSYRPHLVFFLVLPLVFTAVLGAAVVDDGSGAQARIPILVVDDDQSALSGALITALERSDVVQPALVNREEAELRLEDEEAPALVTLPHGLGERLVSAESVELELRRAPGDDRVVAVEQAVEAAAMDVEQSVAVASVSLEEAEGIRPFETGGERQAYFDRGLEMALGSGQSQRVRVEVTQAPHVNDQIATGFEQSSPGELVTWVLITLLGASELLVNERLKGTLRRLFVTPARRGQILAGKVVGQLTLGVIQMTLLIGFGAVVFKVDWGRSLLALAAVALAFALAAVALGIALGTLVRTRQQASGLTILFSMLLGALGGAWWPLEVTPPVYQTAVKVLPSTWAMLGFQDVIVRGQGLEGVVLEAGVLLAFAAVFFAVGVWRFRYE